MLFCLRVLRNVQEHLRKGIEINPKSTAVVLLHFFYLVVSECTITSGSEQLKDAYNARAA
jgi:hypothetical protein